MRSFRGLSLLFLIMAVTLFVSPSQSAGTGTDWHTAPSIEELERMINGPGPQEAIPEIRFAISQALSLRYVAEGYYDAEGLRIIATNLNNSGELRQAAGGALAELLRQAGPSLEELMELAANGETAELRAAADGALKEAFIRAVRRGEMEIADLAALVTTDGSKELKTIAAEAILELLKCKLLNEREVVEDIVSGQTVKIEGIAIDGSISFYRLAASSFLANLYIFHKEWFEDPLEELSAIAIDASLTPEFRAAAGRALAKYLYESDKGNEELESLALYGKSRELRLAGAEALGCRLAEAFKNGEITITYLLKLAARGSTLELGAAAIPGLSFFFSGGLEPKEEKLDISECAAAPAPPRCYCPWYAEFCGGADGYLSYPGDVDWWRLTTRWGDLYRFPWGTRFTVDIDTWRWGVDFDACICRLVYCTRTACYWDCDIGCCDTGSGDPHITCRVREGYYAVRVWSYSGSGGYTICVVGDW